MATQVRQPVQAVAVDMAAATPVVAKVAWLQQTNDAVLLLSLATEAAAEATEGLTGTTPPMPSSLVSLSLLMSLKHRERELTQC